MEYFCQNRKTLRKQKAVSLKDAANQIGISKSSLFSYESEGAFPSKAATLINIANYYNVSIDYLVRGSSDPCLYLFKAMDAFHQYFSEIKGDIENESKRRSE